jgi:hypothetical protein
LWTISYAQVFPDLDLPVIYVAQPYGGMSAAQMEGFITYYYEYHFLYINGIESVESKSIQNTSLLKLTFHPGTDRSITAVRAVVGDEMRSWTSMIRFGSGLAGVLWLMVLAMPFAYPAALGANAGRDDRVLRHGRRGLSSRRLRRQRQRRRAARLRAVWAGGRRWHYASRPCLRRSLQGHGGRARLR